MPLSKISYQKLMILDTKTELLILLAKITLIVYTNQTNEPYLFKINEPGYIPPLQ